MNAVRPAEILRHLEQSGPADADLLARFVATNDAAAFAELVRRHGPLVLGVCRRVTGHLLDAEDAFQATFLVLAQKAATIANAALLGNWLYGVALRVALRAKRSALRRRRREVAVAVLPDAFAPEPSLATPELAPILDEELAALAACYRDAIILCDLRGATREEAAVALGIPEGTLSSRLTVGRKKLSARLTKRGVALSAAALPLAFAEAQAAVAVPNELLTKTSGLVADWSAGNAVPGSLARLAEGGFSVRKLLVLGVAMAVGVAGAVFAAHPREDVPPPIEPPKPPVVVAEQPEAIPRPKEESKPADKPFSYTTSPRLRAGWDLQVSDAWDVRWSPDGSMIAAVGLEPPGAKNRRSVVYLTNYPGKSEPHDRIRTALPKDTNFVGFSPDGKYVITDLREFGLLSGYHRLTFWDPAKAGVNAAFWPNPDQPLTLIAAAKVRTIDFDGELRGYAFPPGGKTFRSLRFEPVNNGRKVQVLEVDAVTGKTGKTLLTLEDDQNIVPPDRHHIFSRDGKQLAVLDKDVTKVTVYDVDRGAKLSEYKFPAENLTTRPSMTSLVFSPDARRFVISRTVGQTVVVNADTGEALPALQDLPPARTEPQGQAFTGDGRLLVLTWIDARDPKVPGGMLVPSFGGFIPGASVLTVWDTQTGKALKTWPSSPRVAFHPTKPILAIAERNGDSDTRVGFWDFAAEVEKK